jgi:hypothetical protein
LVEVKKATFKFIKDRIWRKINSWSSSPISSRKRSYDIICSFKEDANGALLVVTGENINMWEPNWLKEGLSLTKPANMQPFGNIARVKRP